MGTNFPYSISRMVAWDFWAAPSSLGLSERDAQLATQQRAEIAATDPETAKRIDEAVVSAAVALRNAEVGVPFGKPS